MQTIAQQYVAVRQQFHSICTPLAIEDYGLQAMPETSPAKWHLAHTSWFFETFLLKPYLNNYTPFQEQFEVLFNSYYNGIGEQYARPHRHLLSRPTVSEVYDYRQHVDDHMLQLLESENHKEFEEIIRRTILGINHEQQHQELFFTDLKYCLYQNPLFPAYNNISRGSPDSISNTPGWLQFPAGLSTTGVDDNTLSLDEFVFDNETPAHQVYLQSYQLADRLVTNGDYIQFIEDGGYQNSQLWLADGWTEVNNNHWEAPLYWFKQENDWLHFTLHGIEQVPLCEPVSHISCYEADAYARWAGARLPTEQEWETAVANMAIKGQFIDSGHLHPLAQSDADDQQFFGYLWQWTTSAYQPYPGFQAAEGAIGEYNGKFMCNQLVLRGGSYVTPANHIRKTYRNFFYPRDRWQFTGIRLAR